MEDAFSCAANPKGGNAFLTERRVITDNAFVHGSFVGAGTMHGGGDTWTGRKVDADLGLGGGTGGLVPCPASLLRLCNCAQLQECTFAIRR